MIRKIMINDFNFYIFCPFTLNKNTNELRKIVSPKPVHSINDHRIKKKTTVILGTPSIIGIFLSTKRRFYKEIGVCHKIF